MGGLTSGLGGWRGLEWGWGRYSRSRGRGGLHQILLPPEWILHCIRWAVVWSIWMFFFSVCVCVCVCVYVRWGWKGGQNHSLVFINHNFWGKECQSELNQGLSADQPVYHLTNRPNQLRKLWMITHPPCLSCIQVILMESGSLCPLMWWQASTINSHHYCYNHLFVCSHYLFPLLFVFHLMLGKEMSSTKTTQHAVWQIGFQMIQFCSQQNAAKWSVWCCVQKLLSEDVNAWARRPLNQDMLNTAAAEALPLVPMLYKQLFG